MWESCKYFGTCQLRWSSHQPLRASVSSDLSQSWSLSARLCSVFRNHLCQRPSSITKSLLWPNHTNLERLLQTLLPLPRPSKLTSNCTGEFGHLNVDPASIAIERDQICKRGLHLHFQRFILFCPTRPWSRVPPPVPSPRLPLGSLQGLCVGWDDIQTPLPMNWWFIFWQMKPLLPSRIWSTVYLRTSPSLSLLTCVPSLPWPNIPNTFDIASVCAAWVMMYLNWFW